MIRRVMDNFGERLHQRVHNYSNYLTNVIFLNEIKQNDIICIFGK